MDTAKAPDRPALRNAEMRPPVGGWGVAIDIKGHRFELFGAPSQIVTEIAKLQKTNGEFESMQAIWNFCNDVWCRRDPYRCTLPLTWKDADLETEA